MKHPQEKDELRARFTAFLTTMVKRAKLDYLDKLNALPETVSLSNLPDLEDPNAEIQTAISQTEFEFEAERLAQAFATLPLMRRRILQMLFVEGLNPSEIAAQLNCSVGHVYNQRSLALKKLRAILEGGEKFE